MDIEMNRNSLRILKNKEVKYDLPYLWIRDNCPCQDCRVEETKEKTIPHMYTPDRDYNELTEAVDIIKKHII